MKTIGLNIICVTFMLLDASFVPVNCRGDRHQNPRFDVTELIITEDVIDIGSTWADVSGSMTLQPIRGFIAVKEFGIEYKKNAEDAESLFYKASSDNLKNNKIIVRLKGLSPSTDYLYRIYVIYDNDAFYNGEYKTFKTKEK